MMRLAGTALAVVVVALGVRPGTAAAERAARVRTVDVEVTTLPKTPNLSMRWHGRTYRTDRRGSLRIPISTRAKRNDRGFAARLTDDLRVVPTQVRPGVIAKLGRWRGGSGRLQASLRLSYRVTPSFVDLQGNAVDPSSIEVVTLKGRTGLVRRFRRADVLWLPGTRVVAFDAQLVAKPIRYSVESASVDGMNVVNRGQQKFSPSTQRRLVIKLLFYSANVSVKDALFGFPIGKSVRIIYPNGHERRAELEDGAKTTVKRLPRGTYKVHVEAAGYSFTRPVAVSRDQEVELTVVSYLDLAVVFGTLAAIAIGLLWWGRPGILRAAFVMVRRRGRQPAGMSTERSS